MQTRMGTLWTGLLLLAVAAGCGVGSNTPDSPEARAVVADELAELAVELGSVDRALDRGAMFAWKSSAEILEVELGRPVTEEEAGQVQAILRATLAEFLTESIWVENVTRVYSAQFTVSELEALLAFYSSPTGRKALELDSQLTQQVDEGLEAALDDQMEAFIARVDQELGRAFPELAPESGS